MRSFLTYPRSSAFIGGKIPCGVAHRHSAFGGFNLRCTMIPSEIHRGEVKIRTVGTTGSSSAR
jgi:hypothetical protein